MTSIENEDTKLDIKKDIVFILHTILFSVLVLITSYWLMNLNSSTIFNFGIILFPITIIEGSFCMILFFSFLLYINTFTETYQKHLTSEFKNNEDLIKQEREKIKRRFDKQVIFSIISFFIAILFLFITISVHGLVAIFIGG